MRRCSNGKKNITIFLRVPKDEAVRIISRLWAKGIISDKQYAYKIQNIDPDSALKIAKNRLNLQKQIKGGTNV